MDFWTSYIGKWLLEGIITIAIFLIAWKIIGNRLMKRNREKQENFWRTKIKEENNAPTQATKFMTQAEFEEWKAEREKETFKDQGGYLDLDAIAALFRRKTAPELFKDKRPDHQRESCEP